MICHEMWWNKEFSMWCRCEREFQHDEAHRCRCEERMPRVDGVVTDKGWVRVSERS